MAGAGTTGEAVPIFVRNLGVVAVLDQRSARHGGGLGKLENIDYGRRNVREFTATTQRDVAKRRVVGQDNDARYGICGVRGVGRARHRIDHLLNVAVIAGD